MKLWIRILSIALCLGAVSATGAMAADNDLAALALHVATRTSKNVCTMNLPQSCLDYNTSTGSSGFYNVYLTIANYDSTGIAGAQFGIEYDNGLGAGADVTNWKSCADLEFPMDDFPAAGTGNAITWDYTGNCRGDMITPVMAGAFEVTLYSGDVFSITPRQVDGRAKVANCLLIETDITDVTPSRLGQVAFGTSGGYNPCLGPTPVHPRTWGSIKALYER